MTAIDEYFLGQIHVQIIQCWITDGSLGNRSTKHELSRLDDKRDYVVVAAPLVSGFTNFCCSHGPQVGTG
jgi:hypothetical protein